MRIVFDIDGVLADSLHRAKYAPDWVKFYSMIPHDLPIKEGIMLVEALTGDHEIYFITGRPERTRKATEEWLEDSIAMKLDYTLLMKEDGNNELNATTKLKVCKEIKPDLIFEDDDVTAQVLFDEGFKVMLFLRDKEFARNRELIKKWVRSGINREQC